MSRNALILVAALVCGPTALIGPAGAEPGRPGPGYETRFRDHQPPRYRAAPPPYDGRAYGRAPIVSGYLPRNHAVPMYNEPPAR